MSQLRVATWNVNSVRARIAHVEAFVKQSQPDVLCLQETKVTDNEFPLKHFAGMGYEHYAIAGQKSYNGVAIFSKIPFARTEPIQWCGRDDKRHLAITLENGVEIHNFYVPAGGDIADITLNDKFAHKLDFMTEMADWFTERRADDNKMILVGDLNVAPFETDVWNHKQLLKVVSHTPVEVEHMTRMYESHGWVDAMRHFVPEPEPLFSWWSYRARDWRASNRGRRLDHVWVTPSLKPHLKAMEIMLTPRDWEKPSDHAPVVVDFDFTGMR
ncbi:exodeoxyribonuclease III [uncultured Sneathiella sp.]|uniref:exodeoxyribonuclease III n=1 Tax=uncultured Sneathiella sp. TaxID=879315 RepID=UPI0030EF8E84|tara:strand:- start:11263 stop:12075 length:813 start_codon:yes stop_codon:yes gene_type:complete